MVFGKNFLPDIRNYVVQVDFPKVEDWSAFKPGMEIFISDKYVQFVADYSDGDNGMAFLTPRTLKIVTVSIRPLKRESEKETVDAINN